MGAKNGDVEVLRAVAILYVLATHLFWGYLPILGAAGRTVFDATALWTGVDLFFCISGFVIADSLLREPLGPRNWRGLKALAVPFWIRRVFRLLPSAWLWISITIACTVYFDGQNKHFPVPSEMWRDAVAALTNLANAWYAHCLPTQECRLFGIYWSLSLEEQFYLVLPWLLFLIRDRRMLVLLLAAFCAVQVLLPRPNAFLEGGSSLWLFRTDAIILGVLIAMWRRQPSYRTAEPTWLTNRPAAAALLGVLLLLLATLPAGLGFIPQSTGLVALVCAVLVWIASYDRHYVLRPSPVKSALEWVGARSYALYLIHAVAPEVVPSVFEALLGVPQKAFGIPVKLSMMVTQLLLCGVLAELNFRYVESPLRDLGRRIAAEWARKNGASG